MIEKNEYSIYGNRTYSPKSRGSVFRKALNNRLKGHFFILTERALLLTKRALLLTEMAILVTIMSLLVIEGTFFFGPF